MTVRTIRYTETDGPNWAERAFAGHEAVYKAKVMESTWGHLAPIQGVKYEGFVLFAVGCFGDLLVLEFDFKRPGKRKSLDSSPWLYEDLHRFIGDFCDTPECGDGGVFRFAGLYSQSKSTGEYLFDGTVSRIVIPTD